MSNQQKVQIDGGKLFWDMAFQAYRAKAWYDVGIATKELGKTVAKQAPGLIEFIILGSIWIVIISVMLPVRLFAVSVFVGRWCYYLPHRRRLNKAKKIMAHNRKVRYIVQQKNYAAQRKDGFNLDSFCSTFEK